MTVSYADILALEAMIGTDPTPLTWFTTPRMKSLIAAALELGQQRRDRQWSHYRQFHPKRHKRMAGK